MAAAVNKRSGLQHGWTAADAADAKPLLSVRGLRIRGQLGGRSQLILSAFDLDLMAGEVIGIVGESGSGKSMMARALIGLAPRGMEITGSIVFGGRELLDMNPRERARLRGAEIGMVLQDPFTILDPLMRCGRQIEETMRVDVAQEQSSVANRRAEVQRRFAEVGIDDTTVIDRYPFQLSGGMRQRVAIACVLARNPSLLIADEPTTALDVHIQREILQLLRSLQKSRGMALVFITHDLGVAFSFCDRINVLYAGLSMEVGASQAIAQAPLHPYTLALLLAEPRIEGRCEDLNAIPGSMPRAGEVGDGCPFALRCRSAEPRCSHSPTSLVTVADGRQSACLRVYEIAAKLAEARQQPRRLQIGQPDSSAIPDLLRIEGLSKEFVHRRFRHVSKVMALDGVSIRVGKGETVGIVGESGSGKSTLGRCVVGLETADAGTITLEGLRIERFESLPTPHRRQVRSTAQIVFQDPYSTLNPALTIGSTLREILTLHGHRSRNCEEALMELLDKVGLARHHASRKPAGLSGGERQRVAIARALAVRPQLIVLDEAVSALDVSVQAQILELLRKLQREFLVSYLFITHDLAVARQLAHRLYVMKAGRIVEEGAIADVIDRPQGAYARLLRESILEVATRVPERQAPETLEDGAMQD